jgi:uncharacterized caspase-like protein
MNETLRIERKKQEEMGKNNEWKEKKNKKIKKVKKERETNERNKKRGKHIHRKRVANVKLEQKKKNTKESDQGN